MALYKFGQVPLSAKYLKKTIEAGALKLDEYIGSDE